MSKIIIVPLIKGIPYAVYHTAKGKFYLKRGVKYKESDSGNIKRVVEGMGKQPLLRPKEVK